MVHAHCECMHWLYNVCACTILLKKQVSISLYMYTKIRIAALWYGFMHAIFQFQWLYKYAITEVDDTFRIIVSM